MKSFLVAVVFVIFGYAEVFCAEYKTVKLKLVSAHIPGCPCQQRAAHIRNGALRAIHDEDTAMVALRLVQARRAYREARREAKYIWPTAFMITGLPQLIIDLRNWRRNLQTYRMCKRFIFSSLGEAEGSSLIKRLKEVLYRSYLDAYKMKILLHRANVDYGSIGKYMDDKKERSDSLWCRDSFLKSFYCAP